MMEQKKLDPPPDFKTDGERTAWIIQHAEYFTIIRRRGGKYERTESPLLCDAITLARSIVDEDPNARIMVYAVYGPYSAYVTTVCK